MQRSSSRPPRLPPKQSCVQPGPGASSAPTIRPTCRSTSRSIPTRVASTVASIAMRARVTAISTSLPTGFRDAHLLQADAARQLLAEWEKRGYECKPIAIGANTDPYQPAEKSLEITRQLLELFLEHRHPVTLITKSHLVARDLDLLKELASRNLCSVAISIPTMSDDLKRIMEPRVPAATARLRAMSNLARNGVPVSALIAPVIPAINDHEIETILQRRCRRRRAPGALHLPAAASRTGRDLHGLAGGAFPRAPRPRTQSRARIQWRAPLRQPLRLAADRPGGVRGDARQPASGRPAANSDSKPASTRTGLIVNSFCAPARPSSDSISRRFGAATAGP